MGSTARVTDSRFPGRSAAQSGALLIRGTPWRGSTGVHTLMEAGATVLALIVGALALVRFYSKKQSTFLFIGTGFLGTAVLDTFSSTVAVVAVVAEVAGAPPGLFSGHTARQASKTPRNELLMTGDGPPDWAKITFLFVGMVAS